jgi:hypothetical protein
VIAAPPPDADPAVVTARVTFVPRTISPDGKFLAGSFLDREARGFRIGIVAVGSGELVNDSITCSTCWPGRATAAR